ncbi:MAG: hypothetical protein NTW86_31125, partial [Candidatus Sumerlaeota bacterium]|nr:hypothetical protein [Candidatus Sumerlaeota bacterium]
MAKVYLGETVDIHSGGADLVFPHHENELAQSKCANGKPLAKYWLHNGFLTIRGDQGEEVKMSKSLGNDMRIDRVLDRYDPAVVRLFLLSAHYRSPLAYSDSALDEAKAALSRLFDGFGTARKLVGLGDGPRPAEERNRQAVEQAEAIRAEFEAAMDDDFNTPRALAALHRAVSSIHEIRAEGKGGAALSASAIDSLASIVETADPLMAVLGLPKGEVRLDATLSAVKAHIEATNKPAGESGLTELLKDLLIRIRAEAQKAKAFALADMIQKEGEHALAEPLMDLLIRVRAEARKAKAFALADMIRGELDRLGIAIEDHPQGTIWKPK